jgi:nucleotide-binding universal stress UspA family protein
MADDGISNEHRGMGQVLAAIDFSRHADAVIETASALARAVGAELTLLHVAAPEPDFVGYEVGPQTVRDDRAHTLELERRELHRIAEELRASGLTTRAFLFAGATAEKILEEAESRSADWIVVGTHGRTALASAFVGSVSRGVLRGARCPVVVVPAPATTKAR